MEPTLLLTANDQPISLKQALGYLESAGKLDSVLWEIVRQHILVQELQTLEESEMSADVIEQALIEFRLEHHLTNSEVFREWLSSKGLDYPTFRRKIVSDLRVEKLKIQVTESRVQEYFIENKVYLDRVVLSRLVVEEQALAEELKSQILEDGARFEQLAQEYSVAEERIFNGMMGFVRLGTLPDTLRAAIDLARSGEIIGPLEIEGLWYLVRVENFLPAALDEQLKRELEDQLFEQWLEDKVQRIDVKLQVKLYD